MTVQRDKPIATLRALTPDDLDAVLAIDYRHSGTLRRDFYAKRLTAALRNPKGFIYVGVCDGKKLVGFAFARLVAGEFGRENGSVALDAIGVDPDQQGKGLGATLLQGIDEIMRKKGVTEMQSQADWTDFSQLHFFQRAGFRHASRIVLERDVSPFNE